MHESLMRVMVVWTFLPRIREVESEDHSINSGLTEGSD